MEHDAIQLVDTTHLENQPKAVDLIELFYERIYGFLRRLTANDADAADLTQRTFSKVWQKLPTFAGRSSPSSWIHSIAYHLYVDWRRADQRTDVRPDAWWAACPAPESAPDEIAAHRDLHAVVYAFVDALHPDLRDTVHLHYYQELTLQETADALGVALSTVKYRQQQALVELQNGLTSPEILLKSSSTSK